MLNVPSAPERALITNQGLYLKILASGVHLDKVKHDLSFVWEKVWKAYNRWNRRVHQLSDGGTRVAAARRWDRNLHQIESGSVVVY